MTMFRSQKLLDSARDAPCMMCGALGTTVPAHSNSQRHGKGMRIKAHDCYVAYLCHRCHDEIDGRTGLLPRNDSQARWAKAFEKTVLYWFQQGIVK